MSSESISIDKCVVDVVDFLISNYVFKEEDRMELIEIVSEHFKYKTIIVIYSYDKVVGVCRWNIKPDGRVAHVLDICIESKWKKKRLLKDMLIKALKVFPEIETIEFERPLKSKSTKRVDVSWLLKRRF